MKPTSPFQTDHLRVAGLFAGIGGIELGLSQAGHHASVLCEIEPGAAKILETRFPSVPLTRDVRELQEIRSVDLIAAGFPCQDLSQAGRTVGIRGRNSGLVGHVFRLIDAMRRPPRWLLLENVSFMLHLHQGRAMRYLVKQLEERGFSWAYRVVDSRAFGLPQRRQRVLILASCVEDPRRVLLADEAGVDERQPDRRLWRGFYWTEGTRGLGWAVDGVPTLKGGSTIGIPSAPAIWNPVADTFVTPDIRDAERLQGFPADWTKPALEVVHKTGHRWKLVGNAVSVPVARWLGERLTNPGEYDPKDDPELHRSASWPKAAWGEDGRAFDARRSLWPVRWHRPHLDEFLKYEGTPLSERAASGFLSRARASSLRFEDGFLDAVERHIHRIKAPARSRIPA